MYCSKCGTKAIDGALFCQKCGAKLVRDSEREVTNQTSTKANTETNSGTIHQTDVDMYGDPVEMVIFIAKVEGKQYSKWKFSVLIDNIPIGTVPNGETITYKIPMGQHCIKIGAACIWVNIPKDNVLINLNFKWGPNVKTEIICQQNHLVTKASEIEKITFKAFVKAFFKNSPVSCIVGLVCALLGIGVLLYGFVNIEILPFICGILLMAGGALPMILLKK